MEAFLNKLLFNTPLHTQIPDMEASDDTAEVLFQKARERIGEIVEKEREITEVETRVSNIEGIENPSTLYANLASLRTKWQQVRLSMVASIKTI